MTKKILTISAAAALALATAAPARAQANGWPGSRPTYGDDGYPSSYAGARRAAYDNGYREGLKHGTDSARKGKPFDLEREGDYRSADEGYHREFGDKDSYRASFRNGFVVGYREAYSRYGGGRDGYYGARRDRSGGDRDRDGDDNGHGYRDDNGYGYRNGDRNSNSYGYGYGQTNGIAFQNGVSDGYRKGIDDARDGKSPDVTRQKWYRSGNRNYDGRYGSEDLYRREYRRGFEEGYRRAYRE